MKKLIITSLVSLMCVSFVEASGRKMYDEEKEYVKIEKENETSNLERSLTFVECCIDRVQGIIEVNYKGYGLPYVAIYDSTHGLIDSAYATSNNGNITFLLPVVHDAYFIVIQCEEYVGKGYFEIY